MDAINTDATGDDAVIRDLARDDTGEDVKVLQGMLVKRGYTVLEPQLDGVFGRATEACVVHFQWQHGLNTDGVVGPRTRTALGLYARPGSGEGEESTLSEIEGLDLGLGEPLTDHVDVAGADPDEQPVVSDSDE
jgi:Putative peptidoglycan binding domain